MIDFVFTLDYEIFGNGRGSLEELVYEPTRRLIAIFREYNATFVTFAESLELRRIEEYRADEFSKHIRTQLRQLHDEGFEIGLHIHPWWFNARPVDGTWSLDWTERNLCLLSVERIDAIVGCAIEYLAETLRDPRFSPLSFRGGLWLMQPTGTMAEVLCRHGVQIDSSVFKGGRIRDLELDYRGSLRNSYYWHFSGDVNAPDHDGPLLEIPIYTEMVPFWKMISGKRIGLQARHSPGRNGSQFTNRLLDFARFKYPRKLDFCRLSYEDLRAIMDGIILEDQQSPQNYRPIVAIGHSKDLLDLDTVRLFLSYLDRKGIAISSFKGVFQRLNQERDKL